MKASATTGFIGGCIGAIILAVIMFILKAAGMGDPAFVSMYQGVAHSTDTSAVIIATILFIIAGGIWGLLFAILVKNPTVLKGLIFGILPTLWLLVPVNAYLGKPLFNGFDPKGLIMPLIFNMVIWGSVLGWYCAARIPKPVVYK